MAEEQIKLIGPTEDMRDAYMELLRECEQAGEPESPGSSWHCGDDFGVFIRRVRDYAQGKNLPVNWVPDSAYWLVRGGHIIGVCDIRHRLTEALRDFGGHIAYSVRPSERGKGYGTLMLRLALEKARELGIGRVLITCGKDNIASQRMILKNGGVMDSESYSDQAGRVTQRDWIELTIEGRGQ